MATPLHLVSTGLVLAVVTSVLAACGGGGGGGGGGGDDDGSGSAPKTFWLEPADSTVIGAGQAITLYAAFKANATDAYPAYLEPSQVKWSSSNPACATVTSAGIVTGLSACSTTIVATYQTYSDQMSVQVSGSWISRSLAVAGQGTRYYSLYVPDFADKGAMHPLLLSLHGGGGNAMMQAAISGLAEVAQGQGSYVAFLEGTGVIQTYNAGACCGSAQTKQVDDLAYVRAVLDDIARRDAVDTGRIFSSGFSNGGMMSHRLACELADRISGIAAVGGASGQYDLNGIQYYACHPERPIPVLHIHATNDRNYPYGGGSGDGLSATAYYPVEATIADWRVRNNVTAEASIEQVTPSTTCYHYAQAANASLPSARVTLCRLDPVDVFDPVNEIVFGGGHSWPGGSRSPSAKSDVPVTDFNASRYLWRFLNP